jgi:hypothetical protein
MQEIKNIFEWEVLTSQGYKTFTGIKKQVINVFFEFIFLSGKKLKCTPYHLLKFENECFLEACHCMIGDVLYNNEEIVDKIYIEEEIEVYDLLNVENSEYYTNGIISHNCAFIDYIDSIWTSAQATLSTGGQCIALSTPNGINNWFHKNYSEADAGKGKFHPIKLHWSVHPDRNQQWRDAQDELLGKRAAAQECDCVDFATEITVQDIIANEIKVIKIGNVFNHSNLIDNIQYQCKYKVLTPYGFQDFSGIRKVSHDKYLKIIFNDNIEIKCSYTHKFICNGKEVFAKDLTIGQLIDSIDDNKKSIALIESVYEKIDLYDLVDVCGKSIYYTNNVVSHNCDFLTSGDTVIDPDVLAFYEQTYLLEPIEKSGIDKGYWKWEYPDYMRQYLVSVDVARGDGSDYSAFQVIEIATMTQVAEYEGKMDTRAFGRFIVSVAIEWNNALLVIENANLGWDVVQTAIEQNYQNLYYSYRDSDLIDTQTYMNKGYDLKYNEQKVPGFTTSVKSRPLMVSKMELYFNQKLVIIHSKRVIDQLRVFVWKNGKPQATHGYNDDMVLALCIGLWTRDFAVRLSGQSSDMTKKAINLISTSLNHATNAFNPNMQKYNINQRVVHQHQSLNQKNDQDNDLSWLF